MHQELANCERVCDPLVLQTILESASLLGEQGARDAGKIQGRQ